MTIHLFSPASSPTNGAIYGQYETATSSQQKYDDIINPLHSQPVYGFLCHFRLLPTSIFFLLSRKIGLVLMRVTSYLFHKTFQNFLYERKI